MREITTHKLAAQARELAEAKADRDKVNGLNEALTITVLDEPGPGNACHEYDISFTREVAGGASREHCQVSFQNGPIQEAGVNGVSNEALLAIVRDRLESFESGPYACFDNECALNSVRAALDQLLHRTRERTARGVEGTSQL